MGTARRCSASTSSTACPAPIGAAPATLASTKPFGGVAFGGVAWVEPGRGAFDATGAARATDPSLSSVRGEKREQPTMTRAANSDARTQGAYHEADSRATAPV